MGIVWFLLILLIRAFVVVNGVDHDNNEIVRDCIFAKNLKCSLYSENEIYKFINSQHSNFNLELQSEYINDYLEYVEKLKILTKDQNRIDQARQELKRLNSDLPFEANNLHHHADHHRGGIELKPMKRHAYAKESVDFSRHRAIGLKRKRVSWPSLGAEKWSPSGLGRALFSVDKNSPCASVDDYRFSEGKRAVFKCGRTFSPKSISIVFYGRREKNYAPYFRNFFISYPDFDGEYMFPRNPSMRFGEVHSVLESHHKMYVHIPVPFKIVAKTAKRSNIVRRTSVYVKIAKDIIRRKIVLCPRESPELPNGSIDHCIKSFTVEIEPRWLINPTERYKESDDGELFVLAYAVFEFEGNRHSFDVEKAQVAVHRAILKDLKPDSLGDGVKDILFKVLYDAFIAPKDGKNQWEVTFEVESTISRFFEKIFATEMFTAKRKFDLESGFRISSGKSNDENEEMKNVLWRYFIEELIKAIRKASEEDKKFELKRANAFMALYGSSHSSLGDKQVSSINTESPIHEQMNEKDPGKDPSIHSVITHLETLSKKSNANLNALYMASFHKILGEKKKSLLEDEQKKHFDILRRRGYTFYVWPARESDQDRENILGFKGTSTLYELRRDNGIAISILVRRLPSKSWKGIFTEAERRSNSIRDKKSVALGELYHDVTNVDFFIVQGLDMESTYGLPTRYAMAKLMHSGKDDTLTVQYNSMDEGFVNTRMSLLIYVYASLFSGVKSIPTSALSNGNLVLAFALFCYGPQDSFSFDHIHTIKEDVFNGYPIDPETEDAFRRVMCFDIELYNAMNSRMYKDGYAQYFELPSMRGFNEAIDEIIKTSKGGTRHHLQWIASKPPFLGSKVASLVMENLCRGDKGITNTGSLARATVPFPVSCLLGFFHLASFGLAQYIASKYAAGFYKIDVNLKRQLKNHGMKNKFMLTPVVSHLICGQGVYRSKEERVARTALKTFPAVAAGAQLLHPKRSVVYDLMMLENVLLGNRGSLFGESIAEVHHDGVVTGRECVGMFWYSICLAYTKVLILYGVEVGLHDYGYMSISEPKDSDKNGKALYDFVNGKTKKLQHGDHVQTCTTSKHTKKTSKCKTSLGKNVNDLMHYKRVCDRSPDPVYAYLYQS